MTGGRLDAGVIRRHVAALRESIGRLRGIRGVDETALRTRIELRWAVERGLQVCVQNALDIATHIAAGSGMDTPDYASAIDRLGELGVLQPAFAARLRPMAGFRNVLVHAYLETDPAIVIRVLREGLDEIEKFAGCVEKWLADVGNR